MEILFEKTKLLGVRLIGYCVMNNHYHILLENSSGRMSALLKVVNGSYGIYYRRKHGGKGYVFQNRFKSTLIQDDSYLRLAILYLLQNPVRAGLVTNCTEYKWSSAEEYLGKARQALTDIPFVHELWGGKKFMIKGIMGAQPDKLSIKKSDFGDLFGEYEFLTKALERRDKRVNEKSLEKRRKDDSWFEPVEKVYWELEKEYGIKFAQLDYGTLDQERYESTAFFGYSVGGIRLSTDVGRTWGDVINVPAWKGINEVAFARAKNGDIVAACRTDWPDRFRKNNFDHYEGLGVSISKDNGQTWSKVHMLYTWGRHHPSMVVMPNGVIVMTYVVRKGYPDTDDGFPQFGVEAMVSLDHGRTWDLDHRYVLAHWKGIRTGPCAWYASSQATSTLLLPDGALLTAFGTGFRSTDPKGQGRPGPRDAGLVRWTINMQPVNSERTITNAPPDSALRNDFNPDPTRKKISLYCPAQPEKVNIAVPGAGARIKTSASDSAAGLLFHNPYSRPVLTLNTIPAWVEIRWPLAQRIDEIHIRPGAPEWASRPSTECVPRDYHVQYLKGAQWVDLIPPVTNAKRYAEFYGNTKAYLIQDEEFEYVHSFAPVTTTAFRLYVTRSSDPGKRPGSGNTVVVTEDKRETCLRIIEVFRASAPATSKAK